MYFRHGARRRSGFTLVETVIVLGIFSVLVAAIWTAASKARELQKENDASVELQTVAQNIIAVMEGQVFSIGGDITGTMITNKSVPSTYVMPSNTAFATNPWGTHYSGNPPTYGGFVVWGDGPRWFRLTFYNVPSLQSCVALLLQNTNCTTGQLGCPVKVLTNKANTFMQPDAVTGWKILGAVANTTTNITNADDLCSQNDYTGATDNSVEFDFYL